jgi:hypothetical protein
MKVKDIQPIIHSLSVAIEGLKYKGSTCSIEVECLPQSREDKENLRFRPIAAYCEDPYFMMGQSFWKDNFGTRQANRIKKICDIATKNYVEKENGND